MTLARFAALLCGPALVLLLASLRREASAMVEEPRVYCAPGAAPTCFAISIATTADGEGGTTVTMRLSNLQGASGYPVSLPSAGPAWARLYRVDIIGPDDGSFPADDYMTGIALSLSGGATGLGEIYDAWGVVPLEMEPGAARGYALGTDIEMGGADIVGCASPPDLGYPYIRTCAAGGQQPEVVLTFAANGVWTAQQVQLALLFEDPTGEWGCEVSEVPRTSDDAPFSCERVGGTKTVQAIAFTSTIPDPAYVGETYTVAATATSGLPVAFASLTPATCTVDGAVVSLAAAGACTVAADQPGDAIYLPAAQVTQAITIVKRPQAITFNPVPPTSATLETSLALAAIGGGSGNPVVFSSLTAGVCTVVGNAVSFDAIGTCTVAADQAGTAVYEAAPKQYATISVRWPFGGFEAPLADAPSLNLVKAGAAAPVKFSLGADRGLAILAPGSPSSVPISCSEGDPTDAEVATVTAGSSSLAYDATTDLYSYIWKTDGQWTGSCRKLTLRLADGSGYSLLFRFR